MNQAAYSKLISLGFSGTLNQMLLAYYLANGASTPGNLGVAESEFLTVKGFPSGTINERWYNYLGSLTYTGSLNDRQVKFWTNL